MELERARYLVSAEGRADLEGASHQVVETDPLRLSSMLRKTLSPERAAAIGQQLTLRARAAERFGGPVDLLLTAAGLEMMTHPLVAARRAERLASGVPSVIDLTCGLGGDLRFLGGPDWTTIGLERDAATAMLAAANVPAASIVRGDAVRPPLPLPGAAVFIDPSRRTDVRRSRSLEAFTPPWDVSLDLARLGLRGCVKGPPGLAPDAIPPDAEVEFVQLGRSMREAALWFGDGARPGLRRAVLLPEGCELDSDTPQCPAEPVASGPYILDPEPCITTAGLVRHLGVLSGARLLDPRMAYLAARDPASTPFAATFEVLERMDFSLGRLRALLRANHWRPDEIRRRAFPIEPDELRRLLGRLEGDPVTLVCTTIAGQRTIFVARRLFPNC